jgi:predicted alpha/beta-hydrolase family hydrolase
MLLETGPADAPTLILAHGAGAPMDSTFMESIAVALAVRDVRTVRFEFPYMADRRVGGSKRPPPPMLKLESAFEAIIAEISASALYIGGKSMGGRVASMIADHQHPAGVICLGYPFHPAGKPEKLRTAHLETMATRTLIVQGERDPLGRREEVETYSLPSAIIVTWAPDGDHDLKPRKAIGHTHAGNIAAAAEAVAAFMHERS